MDAFYQHRRSQKIQTFHRESFLPQEVQRLQVIERSKSSCLSIRFAAAKIANMPNSRKKTGTPSEKIDIHEHDVLNGRGVNIAQHPGNLRFRALVKSHADQSYCSEYSTSAKKAIAEEIIQHIRNLNPPGRFLKRPSRVKKGGCQSGQWEELTSKETLKKACQALRDCNREDRAEYARHITAPVDVKASKDSREQSGLSNREYAERIAAFHASRSPAVQSSTTAVPSSVPSAPLVQPPGHLFVDTSLTNERPAEGSQPEESFTITPKQPTTTPATVASSGGFHSYPEDEADAGSLGAGAHENNGVTDGGDFQLPFADHFTNSPTRAAALEYDFDLDEEQKLAVMASESTQFDDDLEHEDHRNSLGGHLDEGADLAAVFDGDHLTI